MQNVFHRKLTEKEEPECYPIQIRFMEKPSLGLLKAAKVFNVPIIAPEQNNNTVLSNPCTQAIHVFNEFENNEILSKFEETSNTWILGPTALKEMAQKPDLKLSPKPMYCTFMYPFVFYINCPGDIPLNRRMVKLIKWMGGRFVVCPNIYTTHMITNHTLAKGYRYCYTFKVPILTPAWIEHCWLKRKIPNFDVTSVMQYYRVAALLGLYISFKGTCSEIMENQAIANGATVVEPDDHRCTHLVVSQDAEQVVNITDIPKHIQYVVNDRWFLSSVNIGHRDDEDRYVSIELQEIRKSLWAIIDDVEEESRKIKEEGNTFENFSNSYEENLFVTAKIKTQEMKKKYAFEELYLHEKNFVHCLEKLCRVQELSTAPHQPEEPILKKAEEKTVFGNVTESIQIHQELLDNFEDSIITWRNSAETVHKLIMCKEELLKQYSSFYDKNKKHLEDFESENLCFQKNLEKYTNTKNKENYQDIFFFTCQRLYRLLIQLQEISRNTREDNPDKEELRKAIKVAKSAIIKYDYSPELVANFKNISNIHHRILGFPDYLISYYRKFVCQFSAQEIVRCKGGFEAEMILEFFLFNDILEIAKVRTKHFEAQRPYLHIAALPLSMVVNLVEFAMMKDGKKEEVFGINVKNTEGEGITCIHCFQYTKEEHLQLKDIILLIAKQLAQRDSSMCPEEFIQIDIPITRISCYPITNKYFIENRNHSNVPPKNNC